MSNLIYDLGLILSAAGVTTILFKKLKQPLVLGYIIAGFIVGPNFRLFPTITETENIRTWADIGIIFLLFGLGLEFSFKKLIKVGSTAAITAVIEVSATMAVGYTIGLLFGWSNMNCLFLGGMLAIASTTIIIRAFDESGVKSQKFATVVLGVLVIEDLVAIVLLVLLSTVAVSRQFAGLEILTAVLKLVFFLVIWFVCGIFFIPTFLKRTQKLMNEETMLIVSLALCLMMVVFAEKVGFSEALGAFIMGSILAETLQGEKIEHLLKPVKDLFGAVFFVSVGMLFDPQVLLLYIGPILAGIGVLLACKPLFVAGGALIAGEPLKTSIQAGMSLSQIGEFSFIIATLGVTLHVTADFLYPVAVAISVITTFTTPYMIRLAEPVYRLLEKWLPVKWREGLQRYSAGARSITTVSDWKKILRSYAMNTVIFSFLIFSIIFLSLHYLHPLLSKNKWGSPVTVSITLFFMAPFLWALAIRRSQPEAFANIWVQKKYRGPLIVLQLFRTALAVFFVSFLADRLFSPGIALVVAILIIIVLLLFSKRIQAFYNRIEFRFLSNLNEKERVSQEKDVVTLAPWDAHIARFDLDADSPLSGKSLSALTLREKFGINIAMIERGRRMIMAPGKNELLFPGDALSVIGTDDQLKEFRTFMESGFSPVTLLQQKQQVVLKQLIISRESSFTGKSIRDSGIREKTKGIIVGIERKGERILNPDSSLVFQEADIVWIVGNIRRLQIVMANERRITNG
jgi:CPA2 family monovalent cation:H+ antiporter-2